MLQSVRDNLKGTFVASIVFLIVVVPLVLTSVGDGSYFGSAMGTNAAKVDGREITNAELNRAIYFRKQQLLNQPGADASADYLKDENLRAPVLEALTKRAAVLAALEEGGMAVSDDVVFDTIRSQESFFLDGKFDEQTYRRLLGSNGYTPATYKVAIAEDLLLGQLNQGVAQSAFSTSQELANLVALTQQKRSFYTVTVPKKTVEDTLEISDEELNEYYETNKESFSEEEKMTVQYVELSVDGLSENYDVSSEEIQQQFDQELAAFEKQEEYEIAHLLIEDKDKQAEIISEIQSKLTGGEEFSALVAEYSDDSGSKESGGDLGVMTPGIFPEAFESAVYALEEGQVSEPVETDAGTHLIKLTRKTVSNPPTFEERKDLIAEELKRAQAEQDYVIQLEKLEELTFSAEDLQIAVDELGLGIENSAEFGRDNGTGIAADPAVRERAFSAEVREKGFNSKVVELGSDRAIVLRKLSYTPERIKPLDEVKEQVMTQVRAEKIENLLDEKAQSVVVAIESGTEPKVAAKDSEYEFKAYDNAKRTGSDAGFQVISKAFSTSPGAIDTVTDRDGNLVVVGVTSVTAGESSDMNPQQFDGLKAQLTVQAASFENSAMESAVVSSAEIDIN